MWRGGLAIVTIALMLTLVVGAASAQTVIRVHLGGKVDKASNVFIAPSLFIPIDPTLLKPGRDNQLQSLIDESVTVSIHRESYTACADAAAARLAGGNFEDADAARPTWAPTAYDAVVQDRYSHDGTWLDFCLGQSDGALTVTVREPANDLPAVVNALEGILAATTELPEGAVLATGAQEQLTLPGLDFTITVNAGEWSAKPYQAELGAEIEYRFNGVSVVVIPTTEERCASNPDQAHPPWMPPEYLPTGYSELYVDVFCRPNAAGMLMVIINHSYRDLPAVLELLAAIVVATTPTVTTTSTVTDPDPTPTIVRPATKGPRKPLDLHVSLGVRSLNAEGMFGDDAYGGALGLAKGVSIATKQGFRATVFGTLQGELGYSSYGVDFDAQLRLGLRMGGEIGLTFLVLGGGDAFDAMPAEGYWGVGAALDAFVSGLIVRAEASTVGRLGADDVVSGEIRLEGKVKKDRFDLGVRRTDYRFGSEHPLTVLSLIAGVTL